MKIKKKTGVRSVGFIGSLYGVTLQRSLGKNLRGYSWKKILDESMLYFMHKSEREKRLGAIV